jgi:hypothetical protein
MTVTAIVNVYKRPHALAEQIAAIRAQTIPPTTIFIWNNGNKSVDLSAYKNDPLFYVFDNSVNTGVWSRFILAGMAPTEYVCIFDDDTIPGCKWFENCLEQMTKREALYGTIGVIFKHASGKYDTAKRYGWDGPSGDAKPVDIVGHAWFFKREWVKWLFMENLNIHRYLRNGEDNHFSHMLQKYANIPTFVPPHPSNDRDRWGSMPKTAWSLGCDGNSETGFVPNALNETFNNSIVGGFRIIKHRQEATSTGDFDFFCAQIRQRKPFGLIRPADGEYQVLCGRTLTNIDKWTFNEGGRLQKDLHDALQLASRTSCHVGIPCPECDMGTARWYYSTLKDIHPVHLTFANVLVNANWKRWVAFLKDERVSFTLIGPSNNPSDFNVEEHIAIPEMLVNEWDTAGSAHVDRILSRVKQCTGRIFFFSCGPIAKILVARAWADHPHNIYIDIGSSLDLFLKGRSNRTYVQDGTECARMVCRFTPSFIQV